MIRNAWSEAARAAAIEARRAKMKDKGETKPTGKSANVKVAAAADKVAKINAKLDKAKATMEGLKTELKAAKQDLKEAKGGIKKGVSEKVKGAEAVAKEAASNIDAIGDKYVAEARTHGDKIAAAPADRIRAEVRAELAKGSPLKIARAMGLNAPRTVAEARTAIEYRTIDRVNKMYRVNY